MSNLSDFFGATGRGSGENPHSQSAFAIWTPGISGVFPHSVIINHNLEPKHMTPQGSWYQSVSGNFNGETTDGQWNYVSYGQEPSTQIVQSTYRGGNGSGMNSYLGHCGYAFTEASGVTVGKIGTQVRDQSGAAVRTCGTTIGLQQNYALITTKQTLRLGAAAGFHIVPRSVAHATAIYNGGGSPSHVAADTDMVHLQAAGVLTNGYMLAVGGISYNQRTKKLVIIEREDAVVGVVGNWRPVLIHNAPDPGKYVNRPAAYQAALTAVTGVSANRVVGPLQSASGADLSNGWVLGQDAIVWGRPVLCDNNTVQLWQQNYGAVARTINHTKWTFSSGAFQTPTFQSPASFGISPTYAYHALQYENTGTGAQFQISLDGKTIAVFSNTYYTSCGIQYMLINTETGGHSKIIQQHSTTTAYNMMPIGASSFVVVGGSNSDGTGTWSHLINWESYDSYGGGAGTYTGSLTLPAAWWRYMMDAPGHTTNYSSFFQNTNIDNQAIVDAENGKWQA